MAHGADPGAVGGDGGAHVVLLVDDDVGFEPGQQRREVGRRTWRDQFQEQPGSHLDVGPAVGCAGHLGRSHGCEELVAGVLEGDTDVVGREARARE